MSMLYTTLGPKKASELGLILPHEHVFVDLGPIEEENWRRAEAEAVISLMGPELEAAARSGVTAVVECTPVGVGRRVDIVRAVSEAVQMPLLVATGIYREPWVPEWAVAASEDEVANQAMPSNCYSHMIEAGTIPRSQAAACPSP